MKNMRRLTTTLFFIAVFLLSMRVISNADEIYNTMCLCDSDFTATDAMDKQSIEYFLQMEGSFLQNEKLVDTDGTIIDPADIIYETAMANGINPQVLLAQLQKESSACKTSVREPTSELKFILGCNPASTIAGQIECAADTMGDDYKLISEGLPPIDNARWQCVGQGEYSDDFSPDHGMLVTPSSVAVACLYDYCPFVGKGWGGEKGGNYLFCNAWCGFKFGQRDLIIDDFENGLNWWSDNPWMDASLSNQSELGNYSMEIDVAAGSDPEEVIYNRVPTHQHYWFWGWDDTDGYYYMDEIGQRLLNGPGKNVTKFTLYLCDFDSQDSYTVNLQPRIYKNVGALPGQLFATGEESSVSSSQLPSVDYAEYYNSYTPVTFNFQNGGVFLPNDGSVYNISVKALSFSNVVDLYPQRGPGDDANPSMPIMPDVSSYFFGDEQNTPGIQTYYQYPSCGLAAQIYAKAGLVSRTFATPFDCSKYTKFKITAESAISGNVLDFIYGTDKDYTVDVPITLSNGWQGAEVPISNSVDTSKLAYFAFELGSDGIDSTTGLSKQNTTYIDQIEAE